MEHEDAVREMAVEQYLLGELSGADRSRFEDHLFACTLCSDDLRAGRLFAVVVKDELTQARAVASIAPPRRRAWSAALLRPALLVPSLAASLLLLIGQTFVAIPRLQHRLASAETPAFVEDLAFASGTARGDVADLHRVITPPHGSFLLSVDIPAKPRFTGYRCSLLAPSGAVVWHGELSPAQVRDPIHIRIPASITTSGTNILLIEGQSAPEAPVTEIARHPFDLAIEGAPIR